MSSPLDRQAVLARIGLLLTLAAVALTPGCATSAFCFSDCADGPSGDAGQDGAGGSTIIITLPDATTPDAEAATCAADTQSDPRNCGRCGVVCARLNAFATCVQGTCQYQCASGFSDLNSDLTGAQGNGCEYSCTPSGGGIEICDGLDNDCNGIVDDGNVCGDPLHCGSFGLACIYPHAVGLCDHDVCKIGPCATGFFDLNGDPKDGCEYACSTTNAGKEICDGKDNDCNNQIDDNPDVTGDPLNCGQCGQTCLGAFNNAKPTCVAAKCVLDKCLDGYLDKDKDPANGCEYSCQAVCNFPFATGKCSDDGATCSFSMCQTGHYDIDQNHVNGCEYACNPSNNGVEICDGLDNDCNGKVDDPFLDANGKYLVTNENCGSCGNDCAPFFPGSNVACQLVSGAPSCVFVSCKDMFVNSDNNNANGCEYACTPSNGAVEICDNQDNDCNGVVDDNLTDISASCTSALPGVCAPGHYGCSAGVRSCVPSVSASPEICDGLDNDCNGTADDGPLPGIGFACGASQVGECRLGVSTCSAGVTICLGRRDAAAETCNGKDDDCDGIIDDNLTDPTLNGACGSSVGTCVAGSTKCVPQTAGDRSTDALVCANAVGPSAEVCDGTGAGTGSDENCSGAADEGCVFLKGAPVRLDTNGSAQGANSTFQLTTASAGAHFLVGYSDQRTGGGDIYVRSSTNAGTSWGANDVRVSSQTDIETEPHVFIRNGRGYVVYSRFVNNVRRVTFANSNGSGAAAYDTWDAAKQLWDPGTTSVDCYNPTGIVAKAAASGTADWVVAVWSEIGGTALNPTRNIRLSYSKDGGANWLGTPLFVNTGAGADKAELPVVATDGNGLVYLAWRDKRIAGLAQAYFGRIDLNATTPAVGSFQALQPNVAHASAEQIVIAGEGANVYVAWADVRNAAKNIRVAKSRSSGATFDLVAGAVDGVVVNPDGALADAASPSLAAAAGRVFVAWEDTRSGRADIRFSHSDDGGQTWPASTPRVDTGDGLGATWSYTPSVAVSQGGHVFVAWQDLRFPGTSILANESIDWGTSWHPRAGTVFRLDVNTGSPAAGAAADSQLPQVLPATASAQASVVWVDFRNAVGANGLNGDIWAGLIGP